MDRLDDRESDMSVMVMRDTCYQLLKRKWSSIGLKYGQFYSLSLYSKCGMNKPLFVYIDPVLGENAEGRRDVAVPTARSPEAFAAGTGPKRPGREDFRQALSVALP